MSRSSTSASAGRVRPVCWATLSLSGGRHCWRVQSLREGSDMTSRASSDTMSTTAQFSSVPVQAVREYWDRRPCNVRHSAKPIGTREYFEEVDTRRYFVEPHILRFAEF